MSGGGSPTIGVNGEGLRVAIVAPAAAYSSSKKCDLSPAPERSVTLAPALTSFLTVSGVSPIRGSS